MGVYLITPTVPVCLGVMCVQHQACTRYHAVDNAGDSVPRIATCVEAGEYPLFLAVSAKVETEGTPA